MQHIYDLVVSIVETFDILLGTNDLPSANNHYLHTFTADDIFTIISVQSVVSRISSLQHSKLKKNINNLIKEITRNERVFKIVSMGLP